MRGPFDLFVQKKKNRGEKIKAVFTAREERKERGEFTSSSQN